MTRPPFSAAWALLFCLAVPCAAGTPDVEGVAPPVGAADRPTEVVVSGRDLEPGAHAALVNGGPHLAGRVLMPGGATGVFCRADRVFASFYDPGTKLGGFAIFDVTDPSLPFEVGRWELGDTAAAVGLSDEYALVPYLNPYNFDGGMHVVDTTNEDFPLRVESFAGLGNPQGLAIREGIAYVADLFDGMRLVDFRDPTRPVGRGTVDTAGMAWDVALHGNLAFIADGPGGLAIADVTDPDAPRTLSTFALPANFVLGVAIRGRHAYLADVTLGLVVVDIGDVAAPRLAAIARTADGATAIDLHGTHAFVAGGVAGLEVFDVGEPGDPRWVGSLPVRGSSNFFWDIDVDWPRAYVADLNNGLVAVDLSTFRSPPLSDSAETSAPAEHVVASGELAFTANGAGGVEWFALGPDGALERRGAVPTPQPAHAVAVDGDRLYVAADRQGLMVLDVSDPDDARLLGSYDSPGTARGVFLHGNIVYLADDSRGLQIIDVSDPAAPVRLGGYDTRGRALAVAVRGGLAFVADDTRGLQIIDVSDPGSPVLAGSYDTTGRAGGVAVAGTFVFVADGNRGVRIVDAADPADPRLAATLPTDGRANGVTLEGSTLFLALAFNGLESYDVGDPASPRLVGRHDTPGSATSVAVAGGHALVADGAAGLHSIALNPALGPSAADGGTLRFTVPAGFAPGPYDLRVVNPGGETVERPNAFVVCAARAFAARLELAEPLPVPSARTKRPSVSGAPRGAGAPVRPDPAPVSGGPLAFRLVLEGDAALADARFEARLRLPEIPADAQIFFERSTAVFSAAVEIHLSSDGAVGAVRLIGTDEASALDAWNDLLRSGGAALTETSPGIFDPLRLALRRTDGSAAGAVEPIVLRNGPHAVRFVAPVVHRLDFEAGRLVQARAWGANADLVFEAAAIEPGGCRRNSVARFSDAIDEICAGLIGDVASPGVCDSPIAIPGGEPAGAGLNRGSRPLF